MKQRTELRSLLLRGVLILCICLFGVSLFFLPEIVAKYRAGAGAKDEAQVAKFVFDTNFTQKAEELDVSGMKPGEEKSFFFQMTNQSDGAVCEVDLTYRIQIQDMGNLPYTYSIKQVDAENAEVPNGTSGGSSVTGIMKASQATTVYYKVTVEWPVEKSGAEFSQMVDVLTLRVTCDQED
ncbi:MAG: hypothetical protein IJX62_06005 [Clostridia bacterium]|nr:hypothetical protein [Clostridia bacterium]